MEMPDRFIAGKRQFWREFLNLYQHKPELWDVHHADYRNKELRNESYEVLQIKMQEIQSNATKTDVRRRINIFRTNYRREQMRIWRQQELGQNSDFCRPTLWFYDNMSFLQTQESFQKKKKCLRRQAGLTRKSSCGFKKEKQAFDVVNEALTTFATNINGNSDMKLAKCADESLLLSPKIEIVENELESQTADNSASEFSEPRCSTSTPLRAPKAATQSKPLLSEASKVLSKSWALQYEEMEPTQRILARKAIADILFEGCMGNLRINRGARTFAEGNHV